MGDVDAPAPAPASANISFNGPEPVVFRTIAQRKRAYGIDPSAPPTPFAPSFDDFHHQLRLDFNSFPPRSKSPKCSEESSPVSPTPEHPGPDREEEEKDEMSDLREEIKAEKEVDALVEGDHAVIIKKLDVICDKKFTAIFRKLQALEGRINKLEELVRKGCATEDPYWNFGNPRDIKPLSRYYGMVDKCYAIIMDAVNYNGGKCRDTKNKKSF